MFLFNPDCEDAISIIVLNNLFEYFSNIDYIFDKSKISEVRVLSKEMEIEVNLDEFSDYEIIPIQVDEKIKRLMSVFTNGN